jgi:hypothetical protein
MKQIAQAPFPWKAALLWGVGLIATWILVLQIIDPDPTGAPNQRLLNQILVERFLYRDVDAEAILVGSSMAQKLPEAELGPAIYNLALGGDQSITGLEYIRQKGIVPEIVIVEINSLGFDRSAFRPSDSAWRAWLKQRFPAFRSGNRPVNLIYNTVRALAGGGGDVGAAVESADPERVQARLRQMLIDEPGIGREEAIARGVARASEILEELEAAGAEVIFMQVPNEPEILARPDQVASVETLQAVYPPDAYTYLMPARERTYRTSDAVHLIGPDAREVARQLRSTVANRLDPAAAASN